MGSRTRLAVVGSGRIGRQHAYAIAGSERLELAAVVDPRPAAELGLPEGVDHLPDVAALLRREDIQGAVVAVPTALHLRVAGALVDAGLPVLCEKPCGLTTAELDELAERCSSGLVQAGYWRRFVPELVALREQIAQGRLGTVTMLIAAQWDGMPPPASFRDPASSGGILVDMGVHEFDMVRWLTGQDVVEVTGLASRATYAPPVAGDPETVNLVALLSRGATAVISLTRRYPPGDRCRVEILGGEHSIAVDYLDPEAADRQMLETLRTQAEAFATAIGTGAPAGATLRDARAALLVAERSADVLQASVAST